MGTRRNELISTMSAGAGGGAGAAPMRLRVGSVVNPFLWACGVVTVPLFLLAPLKTGLLQVAMVSVGALPVLGLVAAYVYWAVRDPDRLQSEEYQASRLPSAAPLPLSARFDGASAAPPALADHPARAVREAEWPAGRSNGGPV